MTRIAFFAPVHHGDRIDGREARELARALAADCALTVYIRPDPLRPPPQIDGLEIAPQERFEADHAARAYDHVLYFLANDAYTCGYVASALGTEERNVPGGVVLLRDASMQHHFQTESLYLGNARAYEEGMAHSHGSLGERAGPAVAFRGGHEMMFRQFDVLRSYLESAAMVLAPTREIARRVARQRGQIEPFVRVVPRGIVPAETSDSAWTELLGAGSGGEDAPRFIVRLGDLVLDRRDALEVAGALRGACPGARVLLLGAGAREKESCPEGVTWTEAGLDDRGPLPAVDAVVDLRDPTPGAVEVELLRWMSAGVPLCVADHPAHEALPRTAPIRIALDRPVVPQVLAALGDLGAPRAAAGAVQADLRRAHSVEAEARSILSLLGEHHHELVERRVMLGRLWTGLLEEKRRRIHRQLRDDVFRGVPTDLEAFGGEFVRDVEAELATMGLGER